VWSATRTTATRARRAAVQLGGLSTAFPLCIGTALVVGTLLSYATEPGHTDLLQLCVGLGHAAWSPHARPMLARGEKEREGSARLGRSAG